MGGSRGGTGGPDPPEKKKKKIGFLSNTGLDPGSGSTEKSQSYQVGSSSARQQKAI